MWVFCQIIWEQISACKKKHLLPAGTKEKLSATQWIPAFAGMTGKAGCARNKKLKNSVIPTSRLRRTPPREENLKSVTSSPPTPVRSAPPRGGVSRSDGVFFFFFFFFFFCCHSCAGRNRVYEIYNIQTCVICIILARYAHTV